MNDFTNLNFGELWAGKRAPDSPIKLVGIRGAQEPGNSPDKFAVYDDAILRVIDGVVTQWPASVDPSWALVVHPINPDGAAQLCDGVHLFEKHLMHGQYPCLGQAEDVHVNRLNDDGTLNHVDFGQFGICIHSGGEGMDTGRFSAGCQIIQNPDGYFQDPTWGNFWGPISDGMSNCGLATVPYLLIDRADLSGFTGS